jgi:hypothetical protein
MPEIQSPEKALVKTFDGLFDRSFTIKVKRYVTDNNGTVIPNVAVPAALQLSYPFYLFGEMDRQGGYRQGLSICPPPDGTYFLCTFVNGAGFMSANIVGFNGLNTIKGQLQVGDVVLVFTDDVQNPNYYIWIVLQSTVALASILSNLKTSQSDNRFNRLIAKTIIYNTSNNNLLQWNEALHIIRTDNLGLIKDDNMTLNPYEGPDNFLQNIVIVQLNEDTGVLLDQFIEFSSYMLWSTDQIILNFQIKK